jgi:hypothetical protein
MTVTMLLENTISSAERAVDRSTVEKRKFAGAGAISS